MKVPSILPRTLRPRLVSPLSLGGALCLVLWVATLRFRQNYVLASLDRAVVSDGSGPLVLAAMELVLLNALRATFLYQGWFFLGAALDRKGGRGLPSLLLPLTAIPLCYVVPLLLGGGLRLHFGTSAALGVVSVALVHRLTRSLRGWGNRTVVLALLVFSFQWLDVAPSLTRWGFGQGELSLAVKGIGVLMADGELLDGVGLGGFALAFLGALGTVQILVGQILQARQFQRLRAQDRKLELLRREAERNWVFRELQHLVHDLRRPLTTILGLADVLLSSLPGHREELTRMIRAGEGMDRMIGEILRDDALSRTSAGEVLDLALSQVSPLPWRARVRERIDPEAEAAPVRANRVRLSRALVNLLDNAARAGEAAEAGGEVELTCSLESRNESPGVVFAVKDRGPGWRETRPGESGFGSTGMGLAFVRETARRHEGLLEFRDRPGGGCEVRLWLPRAEEEGEA